MKSPTIAILTIMLAIAHNTAAAQLKATSLRCEYMNNPLAIDAEGPRLSWIVESSQRGTIQTAYEILVASDPKILSENRGDLWESGKILGDQNTQVAYSGTSLQTRTRCFWKVKIWDNHGNISAFSPVASWRMGLLRNADWQGTWIGLMGDTSRDLRPAPFVRTEFKLEKSIRRATAYITARGLFIASLNGNRIGYDVLSPEWTEYRRRIQYLTYDVTPLLKRGSNCAGVIIGDGWYRGFVGFSKRPNNYGDQTNVLLQIHVEYADGSEQVIVSDKSWKGSFGPILFSDLLMGEEYDARLQMKDWDKAGFDDARWMPVAVFPEPGARLVALPTDPIRITQLFKPKKITEPAKGVFVVDLGQNFAGFVRMKVRGKAGTEITIRHAEVLNPDGTIYTTNLRRAKATEKYTLSGKGVESYEPHFTFHGFRYVEITGYPGKLAADAVTGCAINTDLPVTGSFNCSDKTVNQLVSNILWSQRGNFISIPTDCPQRDERLGWMGDAQIFVRTASFNMDVSSFMTKWMYDVVDAQSPDGAFMDTSPFVDKNGTFGAPGWGDAGVIIPWNIYRCYGDTRIIDEHFDAMERWMRYMAEANPDYLRTNRRNNDYGDWLSIEAETPKDLLATAFWAYDARLMADMAKATGRTEAQHKYESVFNSVKSAFQKAYVNTDGKVHGGTQTGYVLALAFDLMPSHLRRHAAQFLIDDINAKHGHLSTGFIGVKYLNPLLTELGYVDIAYDLLFNKTFPSWGFPVTQGATTIWERWDGWTSEKGFQDPGMNSFNHYSMGSVGEWLYRHVAGIDLGEKPGYKEIVVHPHITAQLSYVNGSYLSPQGTIKSAWKQKNGGLKLDVTIPANTIATIHVPAKSPDAVRENGQSVAKSGGLTFIRYENGFAVFKAGSGIYKFDSSMK